MRILNFAILFCALFLGTSAFSYDLERLTTKMGKTYHEIQIIDADEHGLLFRHTKGVAKEGFHQLSSNIRDMFEPVAEIPKGTEIDLDAIEVIDDKGAGAQPVVQKQVVIPDLTLTMIIRRPVTCPQTEAFCRMHPNPKNWPSHWHKFHSAHYLTNPICRAAATRQFLQATGLLPRPCGAVFHHSAGSNSLRFY